MEKIELYSVFKIPIGNIITDELVIECAIFTKNGKNINISAFNYKKNEYMVYFMPNQLGNWTYKISYKNIELSGEFECIKTNNIFHGPVVTIGEGFSYTDGTRYIPFGTTCYAWTNQERQLQENTLKTLSKSPFNKIRMCVFPKSMPYNHNDPEYYPFKKDTSGKWTVHDLDYRFWDNLEKRILLLQELGIEADLILFHPYDRWGFSKLSQKESLEYLEYVVARFSAFSNIWWSLANEYEMLYSKTFEHWDEYGEMIERCDPYHHLISIHNILRVYPKREWMSHCSIQSTNINNVLNWKKEYRLPIVMDECGYEGNLDFNWGNLSAYEMVHRFWWTICRGGYCTHGETFDREDEVLWWAKGGVLYGNSADKIQFLKAVMYSLPTDGVPVYREYFVDPNTKKNDEESKNQKYGFKDIVASLPEYQQKELVYTEPMVLQGEKFLLRYLGRTAQSYVDLVTPSEESYQVEVIDIWSMTRSIVNSKVTGEVRVPLPEKEGIAVLLTREEDS